MGTFGVDEVGAKAGGPDLLWVGVGLGTCLACAGLVQARARWCEWRASGWPQTPRVALADRQWGACP